MGSGFTKKQLSALKKEYEPLRGKTISTQNAIKLGNLLDKGNKQNLKQLSKSDIPFLSVLARNRLNRK